MRGSRLATSFVRRSLPEGSHLTCKNKKRRSNWPPFSFWLVVVVVPQNSVCVPFGVIELSALQHPPKSCQPQTTKSKADWDQQAENFHQRTRNAFSETVSDDADIANAAIRGEHRPATARGTARML